MKIYGAGLAGLIAGCCFQQASIIEAQPESSANHKAVLRFRSKAVADTVGIDFTPVVVRKGIWHDNRFVPPTIQHANWYAKKVVGRCVDRSIWNIEPSERYIAPENFAEQLIARCGSRIEWNHTLTADEVLQRHREPVISTIPMSVMAKWTMAEQQFTYAGITVRQWRLPVGTNVYQTVYVPDPGTTLYRISITKDLLIAEYAGDDDANYAVSRPFGLHPLECEPIVKVQQRFGKIAPIDDGWRKQFMFELTHNYNIFSLGRFGTWRNILLDDVVHDCAVIKRLMNAGSYDRKHALG